MLFLGNKWNKQFFVGRKRERRGGEPSLFFLTISWLSQNCNMAGFFLFSFIFFTSIDMWFSSNCVVWMTPGTGQLIWISLWTAYKQSREKDPELHRDTFDTEIIKVVTISSTHVSETIYACMFWLLWLANCLAHKIILA